LAEHKQILVHGQQARTFEVVGVNIERFGQLANIVAVGYFALESVEPKPEGLRIAVHRLSAEAFLGVEKLGFLGQLLEDLIQPPSAYGLVRLIQGLDEVDLAASVISHGPVPADFADCWSKGRQVQIGTG